MGPRALLLSARGSAPAPYFFVPQIFTSPCSFSIDLLGSEITFPRVCASSPLILIKPHIAFCSASQKCPAPLHDVYVRHERMDCMRRRSCAPDRGPSSAFRPDNHWHPLCASRSFFNGQTGRRRLGSPPPSIAVQKRKKAIDADRSLRYQVGTLRREYPETHGKHP